MVFHQNNYSTQNFHSGTTGSGSPTMKDDETVRGIEKDSFNLRHQVENQIRTINALKENFGKQQAYLVETRAKNRALETKSIAQEAKLNKVESLLVNAFGVRYPNELKKKVQEIHGKLRATEEQLNYVKNENQKLKRKLCDDKTELVENIKTKRIKLAEKCTIIYRIRNELKNEQEKFAAQTDKLACAHGTLETTKEKITELQGKRDSQIILIEKQNECIRELKTQVSLVQPALEAKQRLQLSLEEAQKITQDLEQTIENYKSKTKKLQNRNYYLTAKLKKKHTKLDSNLLERNHLFKFAQDIGILVQFPLNISSTLQNQLPELLAHLKETLQVGGYILQQQNQQPFTLQHISIPSSASSPPPQPQQPSNEEDEDDQLYDEFTSQSMMNIRFPLPSSSSPQPPTSPNINGQTVQDVSILPQKNYKAAEAETTENAGNSSDSLFKVSASKVHQSVTQNIKTKPKITKKAKTGPPRAKRAVITNAKKHEEDVSKRKNGRGKKSEGGAKYFCKCGEMTTSLDRLKVHIEHFNQEKKLECNNCRRRFRLFGHLRQHLTRTHRITHALDNICRLCGKMFETRQQREQHLISSHNDSTSTNPVANEGETRTTSNDTEIATVLTGTVTVIAPQNVEPPQPSYAPRRVPSLCMDPKDEEVDVET